MPPHRPPSVVLFDLDDTLFDHTGTARQALQAVCARFPSLAQHALSEVERRHAELLDEVHVRVLAGEMTQEASRLERCERLLRWAGHQPSRTDVETMAALQRATYQQSRGPVAGAVELLERLRSRAIIGIVTNNLTAEQEDKLRHCRLDRLIDLMVTSEEARAIKPDPAIFRMALERAGCGPESAVVIGDSWASDILGAHAAGIRAVWLNRTGAPCPDPSLAHEIRSLEPTDDVVQLLLSLTQRRLH